MAQSSALAFQQAVMEGASAPSHPAQPQQQQQQQATAQAVRFHLEQLDLSGALISAAPATPLATAPPTSPPTVPPSPEAGHWPFFLPMHLPATHALHATHAPPAAAAAASPMAPTAPAVAAAAVSPCQLTQLSQPSQPCDAMAVMLHALLPASPRLRHVSLSGTHLSRPVSSMFLFLSICSTLFPSPSLSITSASQAPTSLHPPLPLLHHMASPLYHAHLHLLTYPILLLTNPTSNRPLIPSLSSPPTPPLPHLLSGPSALAAPLGVSSLSPCACGRPRHCPVRFLRLSFNPILSPPPNSPPAPPRTGPSSAHASPPPLLPSSPPLPPIPAQPMLPGAAASCLPTAPLHFSTTGLPAVISPSLGKNDGHASSPSFEALQKSLGRSDGHASSPPRSCAVSPCRKAALEKQVEGFMQQAKRQKQQVWQQQQQQQQQQEQQQQPQLQEQERGRDADPVGDSRHFEMAEIQLGEVEVVEESEYEEEEEEGELDWWPNHCKGGIINGLSDQARGKNANDASGAATSAAAAAAAAVPELPSLNAAAAAATAVTAVAAPVPAPLVYDACDCPGRGTGLGGGRKRGRKDGVEGDCEQEMGAVDGVSAAQVPVAPAWSPPASPSVPGAAPAPAAAEEGRPAAAESDHPDPFSPASCSWREEALLQLQRAAQMAGFGCCCLSSSSNNSRCSGARGMSGSIGSSNGRGGRGRAGDGGMLEVDGCGLSNTSSGLTGLTTTADVHATHSRSVMPTHRPPMDCGAPQFAALFLACALLLVSAAVPAAAVFKVASYKELVVAMQAGGPIIVSHSFYLDGPLPNVSRPLTISADPVCKKTQRASRGFCRLDGKRKNRHFMVVKGGQLRLTGLLLTRGRPRSGSGGSIWVLDGGSAILNQVYFRFNGIGGTTASGGAIEVDSGGSVRMTACHFIRNFAGFGGAIAGALRATVVADYCIFHRNMASTAGGAVSLIMDSAGVFRRPKFFANLAGAGSAMQADGSKLNLCNVLWYNNNATLPDTAFLATEKSVVTLCRTNPAIINATMGSTVVQSCAFCPVRRK
ncbi:unnamed protein product [Closterium sp. NIES-53]